MTTLTNKNAQTGPKLGEWGIAVGEGDSYANGDLWSSVVQIWDEGMVASVAGPGGTYEVGRLAEGDTVRGPATPYEKHAITVTRTSSDAANRGRRLPPSMRGKS